MQGFSNVQPRNQSIDLIKIMAMCLVICLHTTHQYLTSGINDIIFVLYNTSAIAIPLFFMVNGFLLIGRNSASYRYSFIKIFKTLKFVLLMVVIWWICQSLHNGWSIEILIYNFFGAFIQHGSFWMYWYFGAMMIIYLLYPLINKLYLDKKYYLITLLLISCIQNIAFIWNVTGVGESMIIQTFRIWNWIFYFMIGGLLKTIGIEKRIANCIILVSFIANIVVIDWLSPYMATSFCEYFYSSPVLILLAVFCFLACKDLSIHNNIIIANLSKLFLPVYTLHPFVIRVGEHFPEICFNGIAFWIYVTLATLALSFILMKIPFVNRLFDI